MSLHETAQDAEEKLLITGASGHLGRRAAELAIEACAPERLILVTRRPERLADLAARGAEVRAGDFSNPASLARALEGAERMLLVSATDLERRIEQHGNAVRAAADTGVRHVVYTSGLAPEPPNPAAVAPSHYATERALEHSGLGWTVLRNSLYAEYQAPEAQRAIETGKLVHNRGEGRVAYVSREDCARAAAAVLVAGGHDGAVYDITGAETYDALDLAALYGQLAGREIKTVSISDEALVTSLVGQAEGNGHLRYGAELVASFGRSIREGYMASCSDAVATLTGRPPRPLRDVLAGLLASR